MTEETNDGIGCAGLALVFIAVLFARPQWDTLVAGMLLGVGLLWFIRRRRNG